MNRIDLLKKNYQKFCENHWDRNVSGAQRVWLAVYDKEDERKLRLRLGLFEEATHHAGRKWKSIDLTNAFANWMCGPDNADYAESYFESPDSLDNAKLGEFMLSVVNCIRSALAELPDAEWSRGKQIVRATRQGPPFLEIVRYAKENEIDMIVLGTHGRGGLAHMLMGSVAEKVVRKAPCPVLTVRPEGHQFEMP